MSAQDQDPQTLLEETAGRLHDVVANLAARLRPFPAFLNMTTVQAIELEPPAGSAADLGCVVVLPDGEICELELKTIPGPGSPSEVDQVEEYRELELPPEQYVLYAASAIGVLYEELRRRGEA
jgi:hypothetical protein